MAFSQFIAPALLKAPETYDPIYFNQLIRVLSTYFKILNSTTGTVSDNVTANILTLPTNILGAQTSTSGYVATAGLNNNIIVPNATFIRITASGNFSITGVNATAAINPGVTTYTDGQVLILYNASGFNMTVSNQSASSVTNNRFLTNTGADIVTTGNGVVTLVYSIKDNAWVVISVQL